MKSTYHVGYGAFVIERVTYGRHNYQWRKNDIKQNQKPKYIDFWAKKTWKQDHTDWFL